MRKTRIAICINGVIREPTSTIPYLKDFFNSIPESEIDFFIYTSKKSQINFTAQQIHHNKYNFSDNNTFTLNDEDIKLYFDSFNIKDYIIEGEYKELKDIVYTNLTNDQAQCWENDLYRPIQQFYGAEKCNELKRKYEEKNNFKYDVVFRIRPDLFLKWNKYEAFPPKNLKEWQEFIFDGEFQERGRLNQIFVSYIDIVQGMCRFGDNFMYGNSQSMDIFMKDITINSINFWKDKKNITLYEGVSEYRPAPENLWAAQAIKKKNSIKFSRGFWHEIIRVPISFIEEGEKALEELRLLTAKSAINDRKQKILKMENRINELTSQISDLSEEDPLRKDYQHRIKTLEIEIGWHEYGIDRDKAFLELENLKNKNE